MAQSISKKDNAEEHPVLVAHPKKLKERFKWKELETSRILDRTYIAPIKG